MIYCIECMESFEGTIEEHVEEYHSGPYPVHHDDMPDWIQDHITDDECEVEWRKGNDRRWEDQARKIAEVNE